MILKTAQSLLNTFSRYHFRDKDVTIATVWPAKSTVHCYSIEGLKLKKKRHGEFFSIVIKF